VIYWLLNRRERSLPLWIYVILRPEVYHNCHIGVVFSATNYSLVPLEMMACNLPVEIDTESPRAIFKEGEVSFAAPDPGKIDDAIEELTRNASLLARQREKARNFVSGLG
jgi:O-antigen biosynthesis protein